MDDLDRLFLNDFVRLAWMNHVVSAIALYNAGLQGGETAAEFRAHSGQVSFAEGKNQGDEPNDATRIQAIVSAKLVVEFGTALEDLGALCEAIRHRNKDGLFSRYVSSSVGQVADFFDHVGQNPEEDLSDLLNLPSRDLLQELVPQDLLESTRGSYQLNRNRISKAARWYRSSVDIELVQEGGESTEEHSGTSIVLGTPGDELKVAGDKRHVIVQAMNKIKHRFLVVDRMDELQQAAGSRGRIPSVPVQLDADRVSTLFNNIVAVSLCAADVAATVLVLDEQGAVG